MKPELILQADILDIIFENRNKQYGAYNLRKGYNHRMLMAMSGALFLTMVFYILNFMDLSTQKATTIFTTPDVVLKVVDVKPPKLPAPPETPKAKPATIQYSTPLIVKEDVVETLPELKKIAEDVLIGTETIEGPPATATEPPGETSGTGSKPVTETGEEKPKILHTAQFMPEFPGGHSAFVRFLSKNLRVPDEAVEPGQKVKVLVQFVVGIDGSITDITFLQANGEVFEQEVLRVMKKMPRWKPGMQNGKVVAVYFKLPVIFEAHEE